MGENFILKSFLPILILNINSITAHNFLSSASQNYNTDDSLSVLAICITDEIKVDGLLNESAWMYTEVYTNFIQREPDEGTPVSEKTELRILYDEDNLYLGIHCYDNNPNNIIANEMRRDNVLINNDAVEIFLDTYHDRRNAFYFSTNPLGARMDGIITAGLGEQEQNWDWNGVWDCASTIDNSGWTTEIKIPFKILRFPDNDKQVWGFNVSRIIPRKREEAFLFPISREFGIFGKFHLEVFGELKGIESIHQPEKFQIKPFTVIGAQRDFEEKNTYEKELEFGLDAKYLLTSNLTLDLTLNTDFAQVEADQEQVNLTRFELFFPEKREFFLEGASIFSFGERAYFEPFPQTSLFFSRRIGLSEDNEIIPIIGGLRLTGKATNYQLGFMNIFTNKSNYINDDDENVFIPTLNFTALRVKKDILNNSYIGVIGLNKQSLDDKSFNRSFGVDGNIYLNENLQFGGFAAKTSSPEQPKKDYAFYGDLLYVTDLVTVLASQSSIQDNFNSEMGFALREGVRTTHVNAAVSPRPDFWNIRQIYFFGDFYYYAKQNNTLESRPIFSGIWTGFQSGAYLIAVISSNYENLSEKFEIDDDVNIQPGIYKFNNYYGEFQSDLSKPISGRATINAGQFYDGNIRSYGLDANLKFGNQITFNINYNYNSIDVSAGSFNTNLLGFRFLYTFSPKMFLKTFIQWNSQEDVIIGNVLFNFIHTPGSDLYIVYNEELDTTSKNIKSKNRTLLLKLTYLFSL